METKKSNPMQMVALILVLVLVMAFVGYRFVISPMLAERDEKKEENYNLKVRKIELQNLATQEQFFIDEIEKSRIAVNKALNSYGGGNTPEKSIMFIKNMEDDLGVVINSISFSSPTTIQSVRLPKIAENEDGTYSVEYKDIEVQKESLTFPYECDYEQLKQMNDYLNSYPEKMNVDNITAAYNSENGKLSGNIALNLYAVIGGDNQYVEPEILDIRLGEENIFTK